MKRLPYLAIVGAAAIGLALLPGTTERVARADTPGTPAYVGAYGCIFGSAGHVPGEVNVPAGSTVVIRQGFSEYALGMLDNFLQAQTTIVSVNDQPMFDVSDQWSAPFFNTAFSWWTARLDVPTGVTLAQGASMRFTWTELLSNRVSDVMIPADGAEAGRPAATYGPGLVFGGTCTVTAT